MESADVEQLASEFCVTYVETRFIASPPTTPAIYRISR